MSCCTDMQACCELWGPPSSFILETVRAIKSELTQRAYEYRYRRSALAEVDTLDVLARTTY